MRPPLSPAQLRRSYDPAALNLENISQTAPPKAIIGQDRAIKALKFGLGNSLGFNVFISGFEGEGEDRRRAAFPQGPGHG